MDLLPSGHSGRQHRKFQLVQNLPQHFLVLTLTASLKLRQMGPLSAALPQISECLLRFDDRAVSTHAELFSFAFQWETLKKTWTGGVIPLQGERDTSESLWCMEPEEELESWMFPLWKRWCLYSSHPFTLQPIYWRLPCNWTGIYVSSCWHFWSHTWQRNFLTLRFVKNRLRSPHSNGKM